VKEVYCVFTAFETIVGVRETNYGGMFVPMHADFQEINVFLTNGM